MTERIVTGKERVLMWYEGEDMCLTQIMTPDEAKLMQVLLPQKTVILKPITEHVMGVDFDNLAYKGKICP